jgi:polysaccharide biosynthesis protein PslG
MVKRFNDRGIKILGVLTYIPEPLQKDWSVIDREFRRFVNAATKRYAARGVHTWEVFNEPNLTGYGWLTREHDSRDYVPAYTLLLARVNAIVRKNDPKGVVVLGGLAGDNERTLSPEETMRTIYRLGARKCFDVFAYHPYGYQNRFSEARARIEAILAAGKDVGKRVWFNEYGWTDYASMDMEVHPTAETNPLMAAFKQRKQAHALFWFAAKDYSAQRRTPTFGLADYDLKKRPSFKTFKYLVQQAK